MGRYSGSESSPSYRTKKGSRRRRSSSRSSSGSRYSSRSRKGKKYKKSRRSRSREKRSKSSRDGSRDRHQRRSRTPSKYRDKRSDSRSRSVSKSRDERQKRSTSRSKKHSRSRSASRRRSRDRRHRRSRSRSRSTDRKHSRSSSQPSPNRDDGSDLLMKLNKAAVEAMSDKFKNIHENESSIESQMIRDKTIKEINDPSFLQKVFVSNTTSKNDQPVVDISAPTSSSVIPNNLPKQFKDSLLHPNMIMEKQEDKLNRWVRKLYQIRQRSINGEPLDLA